MEPVYTDREGMASMLGTLVPGKPDWDSGTAIDADVTWTIQCDGDIAGPAFSFMIFRRDSADSSPAGPDQPVI